MVAGLYLVAHARLVRPWSDDKLEHASDLIVIATAMTNVDLDETNSLGFSGGPAFQPRFRGVDTTFRVLGALKGITANDRIVLHHYRTEPGWGSPPNGPMLVEFPSASTNRWLLFLVKDGGNRYAPVTGQIDPYLSIRSATNVPRNLMFGFPYRPPIADADPSIRYPVSIRVPTRLKVLRTADSISMDTDPNSVETETITVGTNMATGSQSDIYIYPSGQPPKDKSATGGMGGGTMVAPVSYTWHTAQDGIPVPGKKYDVEVDLKIFETDIPPQHMWEPQSKKYKILWQRTLKETVE